MPIKKKQYCEFCGKNITERPYITIKEGTKYYSCSACKYMFNLLYKELDEQRFNHIRRMLDAAMRKYRHCSTCKRFRLMRTRMCAAGSYTGIDDSHQTEYPLSYANHGCTHYSKLFLGTSRSEK